MSMPFRAERNSWRGAARVLLLACGLTACGGSAPPGGDQKNAGATAAQESPAANASPLSPAQTDAEVARLEKQVERTPGDDAVRLALSQALVRRANSLLAGGRLEEAERDFQSALQHNPDNEEAQKGLAALARSRPQQAANSNNVPAPISIPSDAASNTAAPSPTREDRRRRP